MFKNNEEKDPNCQRDEWPPFYFLPSTRYSPEHGLDAEPPQEWSQLIRWLPGGENGGAADAWSNFCAAKDGNEGNYLRISQRKLKDGRRTGPYVEDAEQYKTVEIRTDKHSLVNFGKYKRKAAAGRDGTMTTTHSWDKATYTHAVFVMTFDKDQVESFENDKDYLLSENPCKLQSTIMENDWKLTSQFRRIEVRRYRW